MPGPDDDRVVVRHPVSPCLRRRRSWQAYTEAQDNKARLFLASVTLRVGRRPPYSCWQGWSPRHRRAMPAGAKADMAGRGRVCHANAGGNHSFEMIRCSGGCVINLPTTALTDTVVRIGNVSGAGVDKFCAFGLGTDTADEGGAFDPRVPCQFRMPPSRRCAGRQVQFLHLRGGEGARRRVPKHPETLHYTGDGCSWRLAR